MRRRQKEEVAQVDLIVTGCVVVSPQGGRIGKGEGYSDLEFGIIQGVSGKLPPVVTTVHPYQIKDEIPREDHDVALSWIVTPDETMATSGDYPPPPGLNWDQITDDDLEAMPVLREVKDRLAGS